MVDVFISYSRADAEKAGMLARMIASEGYQVWWDADLPPHMSYGDVITTKITAAKAAVVVWSQSAVESEWVRAEADVARNQKKLIQTALSPDIALPLPFNQIQFADIGDWQGEADHRGWQKVRESLVALCGPRGAADEGEIVSEAPEPQDPAPAPAPAPTPAPAPSPAPSSGNSGTNTALIVGLGCGGLALLGMILFVFLAILGGMEEYEEGEIESFAQPVDETLPAIEEGGNLPEIEPVPDAGGQANSGGNTQADPFNPVGVTFLVATINDPDGYTNVRAGPSTNAAIIAQVEQGDVFATYQQDTTWWAVGLDDGTEGYIHSSRITVIGPMQ